MIVLARPMTHRRSTWDPTLNLTQTLTLDPQVPVYLAAKYRRNGVYKDARTILAIHNLSHQGVDPAATFSNLGLPDDM